MIKRVGVQGYRCIKDVDVALTPLHALVGPNDSGKSTLLGSISTITRGLGQGSADVGFQWQVEAVDWAMRWDSSRTDPWPTDRSLRVAIQRECMQVRWMRLDPDAMRRPNPLIASDQPLVLDVRGQNLSAVLDGVRDRNDGAWRTINERMRELFPTVDHVFQQTIDGSMKVPGVRLKGGTAVPAGAMSEGMLYWLAFAVLEHVDPISVLLIEEPENGLHPARIREVIGVLRRLSERGTQVLMATHSPLVINELRPDEVSVVTRTSEEGTKVTPIARTPRFAERAKIYALGELWLAYCDGNLEAPLLEGTPRLAAEGP